MPTQTLSYSIATDIPAGQVSVARLRQEINDADSGIATQLESITVQGGTLNITFKVALSAPEKTALDGDSTAPAAGLLGVHSGEALPEPGMSTLGNPIVTLETTQKDAILVAPVTRNGKETIYATHNFTDSTTWYSRSKRVVGETPSTISNSGGKKYRLSHKSVINLKGGNVFDEEGIIEDQAIFEAGNPHGFSFRVYADGNLLTEAPHFIDERRGATYDYEVDYQRGEIYFNQDMSGVPLTVDYSHADVEAYNLQSELGPSTWILRPLPGRALFVNKAEVQASFDLSYNQTMVMEVYAYAHIFAPQLGLPLNTLIPVETTLYKTIMQFVDEAVNSDAGSDIRPISPHTDRGFVHPMVVYPFMYSSRKQLYSSLGMEIRIYGKRHVPFGGERMTASFYMNSKTDPGIMEALARLQEES